MIRLPTSADRMYKSTDRQYQDELAVPQDACDRVCGANYRIALPRKLPYLFWSAENETLRFCCEFW